MLLDDILPVYDFTEVHTVRIKSSPEVAFSAVMEITPGEISGIMRLLFFLRSLPEKVVGRDSGVMDNGEPVLRSMLSGGFTMLADDAPREFVFGRMAPGNIGRVWNKSSGRNIVLADAREFLAFNDPGYICVVANFLVNESEKAGYVTVRTESRSRALSLQARRDFTPYWRIIRPFSGLIRRLWLSGIKNRAEKRTQARP